MTFSLGQRVVAAPLPGRAAVTRPHPRSPASLPSFSAGLSTAVLRAVQRTAGNAATTALVHRLAGPGVLVVQRDKARASAAGGEKDISAMSWDELVYVVTNPESSETTDKKEIRKWATTKILKDMSNRFQDAINAIAAGSRTPDEVETDLKKGDLHRETEQFREWMREGSIRPDVGEAMAACNRIYNHLAQWIGRWKKEGEPDPKVFFKDKVTSVPSMVAGSPVKKTTTYDIETTDTTNRLNAYPDLFSAMIKLGFTSSDTVTIANRFLAYEQLTDHNRIPGNLIKDLDRTVVTWGSVDQDTLKKAVGRFINGNSGNYRGAVAEIMSAAWVIEEARFLTPGASKGNQNRILLGKDRAFTGGTQDIDFSFSSPPGKAKHRKIKHYQEIKADPPTLIAKIKKDGGAQIGRYEAVRADRKIKHADVEYRVTFVCPTTTYWFRLYTDGIMDMLAKKKMWLRLGKNTNLDPGGLAELIKILDDFRLEVEKKEAWAAWTDAHKSVRPDKFIADPDSYL